MLHPFAREGSHHGGRETTGSTACDGAFRQWEGTGIRRACVGTTGHWLGLLSESGLLRLPMCYTECISFAILARTAHDVWVGVRSGSEEPDLAGGADDALGRPAGPDTGHPADQPKSQS